MNSKNYIHTALAAAAITLTLGSCSKRDEVAPATQTVATKADVSVVNGRLVFANQQAFDKVFAQLEQVSTHTNSKQELATWESAYNFTSLRAAADKESGHLEELDAQNKTAPAYQLLTSFGFPTFYAAIINQSGEYQIGDKLYWYHDGFRYQAASEAELTSIKQTPATAQLKSQAGARVINSGNQTVATKSPGSGMNITMQGNDPYSYDKYIKQFTYPDDAASIRRIIYATVVYVEDNGGGDSNNPGLEHFYSNIRLNLKLEYYSQSQNKWYPAHETYFYNYSLDFTGNTFPVNGSPYNNGGVKRVHLDRNFETGDGLFDITIAEDDIYASLINYNQNSSNIQWNFSINGSISSYAKRAPGSSYPISGNNIW